MPSPESMASAPVSADIPDLKKKDKEKRGGGFVWTGGASPAGSGFFASSSPGLLGSGRIAMFLGRALGGSSSAVGKLLLSKAGSYLVLGGMGAALFSGVVGGAWVINRGAPAAPRTAANSFIPVLDGVSDAIRIHRPQDTSLNNLKGAPGVEPDYGQHQAPKAAPAEEPAAVKPEAPVVPNPPATDALADQAKKAGLDMSKLSGLAGLGAAGGGGGGVPNMPNIGSTTLSGPGNEFKLKSNFVPQKTFTKLKSITPFENKVPMTSTKEGHQKATSQRAMGQLKFANDMSNQGSGAGSHEAGKTFATDAFEQGKTTGGVMQGIGDGIVTPNPNPAPNMTYNPGTNVTPYQNQITSAQQNSGTSAALHLAGLAAIAAGIALVIAGIALLPWPTTPMGVALIAAGIALIMAGMAMLAMSAAMAQQAQHQGDNINNQYGQATQANIVNNCSQQATQNGVQPQNCNAPFTMPSNNIHQSVADESNSTYNLGGGAPMSGH